MRRLVARWLRALARASVPASTEAPDIERARADAQARRLETCLAGMNAALRKEIHGQDSNEGVQS